MRLPYLNGKRTIPHLNQEITAGERHSHFPISMTAVLHLRVPHWDYCKTLFKLHLCYSDIMGMCPNPVSQVLVVFVFFLTLRRSLTAQHSSCWHCTFCECIFIIWRISLLCHIVLECSTNWDQSQAYLWQCWHLTTHHPELFSFISLGCLLALIAVSNQVCILWISILNAPTWWTLFFIAVFTDIAR